MEPQIKPSIRKQFLDKIYQRNLHNTSSLEDSVSEVSIPSLPPEPVSQTSSFMTHISQPVFEAKEPKPRSEPMHKRSSTPSIHARPRSISPSTTTFKNNKIFTDFLTDLCYSNGVISPQILNKVQSVSKALTENFTKNPEFSLEFYICMNGIINTLAEPDTIDFDTFRPKVEEAINLISNKVESEHLKKFNEYLSKLNLKLIETIKKLLTSHDEVLNLSHAYMVLVCEADKDLEVLPLKKIQPTKILGNMQKYLLMPGKMMQTCRKIGEFITQKKISVANAKFSQEILSKLNRNLLMELDKTSGLELFAGFLEAAIGYFWSINPSQEPMEKISLIPNKTDKKLMEFEEAVELSKELLKQSSRSITPSRRKVQMNSSEIRSLVTQNSFKSKSESTKSLGKDSYETMIEDKYKEFLRDKNHRDYHSLASRVQVFDLFERSIRDEIRNRFLVRIIDDELFQDELRKVSS